MDKSVSKSLTMWGKEEWLRNAGWNPDSDETWSFPDTKYQQFDLDMAFHIGQFLVERDEPGFEQ